MLFNPPHLEDVSFLPAPHTPGKPLPFHVTRVMRHRTKKNQALTFGMQELHTGEDEANVDECTQSQRRRGIDLPEQTSEECGRRHQIILATTDPFSVVTHERSIRPRKTIECIYRVHLMEVQNAFRWRAVIGRHACLRRMGDTSQSEAGNGRPWNNNAFDKASVRLHVTRMYATAFGCNRVVFEDEV